MPPAMGSMGRYVKPSSAALIAVANALNAQNYAWTERVGQFSPLERESRLDADLREHGYVGGPVNVISVHERDWETVAYDTTCYGPDEARRLPF